MVISDDILTKSGEISQKGLLFLFWAKYITFVHSVLFHMFKKLKIHEKIQDGRHGHVTRRSCDPGYQLLSRRPK